MFRKFSLTLILVLCIALPGNTAIMKYQDVVQDRLGNAVSNALVQVFISGTATEATLYSAITGTPTIGSVLTTDANGSYWFYAAEGTYDFVITKTGITTQQRTGVVIGGNKPWIEANDYPTLAAADAAAVAAGKELRCTSAFTISSATTITSPFNAEDRKCSLTKAGSGSLYFVTQFKPGKHAILNGFSSGDVSFASGSISTISPLVFGAAGDGVTIDILAINAAIKAAPPGAIIDFSGAPVQYLIDSPIIYDGQKTYKGSGVLRTVLGAGKQDIKLADGSNCNVFEDRGYHDDTPASYASHAIFDGLTIDANSANNSSGNGIISLGGSYVDIRNCTFKMIPENAVYISMQTAATTTLATAWYGSTNIRNNTFYGFGNAAVFNQAIMPLLKNTDSYIQDNLSVDGKGSGSVNGEWAFYLEGSAGWHVTNNHSFQTKNGIRIDNPANNSAVTDNIIEYAGDTSGGPYYGVYSKMTADVFSIGSIISQNYFWLWGTTPGIEYYGVALEPNDSGGTFWQMKKYAITNNMFRGFTNTVTRSVGIKFLYSAVADLDADEFRIDGNVFPTSLPDDRKFEVTHHAVFNNLDGYSASTTTSSYYIGAAETFLQGDATSNSVAFYLPFAARSKGRTLYFTRKDSSETYSVAVSKQGSDTLMGRQYLYQPGDLLVAYSDGASWFVSGKTGVRFRNGTPVGNVISLEKGEILINTFPDPDTVWVSTLTGTTGGWLQISN